MSQVIEAVYEKGLFRPKEPITLSEGQTVQILLSETIVPVRRQKDERLRRHFGVWRSGDPHSADNERIDADLARAYADAHEPEA